MALELKLRAIFKSSVRFAEAAAEEGGDPSQKAILAEKGRQSLNVAFGLLQRAREQVMPVILTPTAVVPIGRQCTM